MANLGFIGLGTMGTPITERLLAAGHTVTGYNRTRSKATRLIEAGMRWAGSPREVAETADMIFSMVFNDEALQAITVGPDGVLAGLGPGKIYADMSTVSPQIVRQLARQATEREAQMLDSPVSGGPTTVREGKLTFMVAGDQVAFEKIKPILLDIGSRATYIGESGQAAILKIALNLSIPVQLLALFEGLALAEKNGIPRELALEVMLNSAIASPAMKYRGPFALELPKDPLFNMTGQRKDIFMALEMGHKSDVPLPITAATAQIMATASALGYGDEDFGVMYKVLARMAGLAD
ncbi:MAG: NAD(P)-dependent oxidoreductase [Chloroflexi bacterium]|nr:NAD(P)-dependent oxidoreductase [Chloroflexota bacterium]